MSASSEGLKNIRSFKRKKLPDFQSINVIERKLGCNYETSWVYIMVNIEFMTIYHFTVTINIRVV